MSDDWLITPKIFVSEMANLNWFGFSLGGPIYPDTYQILVSTTDSLPSSFTTELITIDAENEYQTERSVGLEDFIGDSIFIAFRNISFDKDLLILDDILVSTPMISAIEEDIEVDFNLIIEPNPATDFVNVSFEGEGIMSLFDVSGKAIYNSKIHNSQRIELDPSWSGIYFMKIVTKDKRVLTHKFFID